MGHSDISLKGLVGRLPPKMQAYALLMRLDRPIGTWLLLLPAWWALALSGMCFKQVYVLFAIGALIMRGAGCVINDLWDRDLDGRVERTKERPLVSGALSRNEALGFLGVLLVLGLWILIQFNNTAIWLGVLSLGFVIVYPLMKRFTWWPQLFLGFTFNFGALIGWAVTTGSVDAQAWFLYAAGIFWTLGYDTIYAHQDKVDDALIGVRSTARLFGDQSKYWVAGFYGTCVALLAFAVPWQALIAPALHFGWQIWRWNIDDADMCLRLFKSNRDAGLMLFLGIIAFN